MSIFEIAMLICFGAAWPFSIRKSYISRTNKGKSPVFLFIVLIGYASGILHKVFYSMDMVIWLYAFNGLLVLADMGLYFRNQKLDEASTALSR